MSERIMYLRETNGNPIGCIAIGLDNSSGNSEGIVNRIDDSEDKHVACIKYSVSVLHPSDLFNKSIAKKIATGRLREKSQFVIVRINADKVNGRDITHAVMYSIATSNINSIPDRAAKAARLWLLKQLDISL